jgi:hypothetical protein
MEEGYDTHASVYKGHASPGLRESAGTYHKETISHVKHHEEGLENSHEVESADVPVEKLHDLEQ